MSLLDIAVEVGTPFYCYSLNSICKNYREFADNIPGSMICYAVKANPNIAIIKAIANMGGGADVVSGGEIRRAMAAGVPVDKIVFSGIGKTREEIEFALENNIYQINAESKEELELINQVASSKGIKASVAIRVNPNIDAKTNDKITTGLKTNKFGIPEEYIDEIFAKDFSNINLLGISVHIGSQISNLNIFLDVIKKIKVIISRIEKLEHKILRIDLGGGLGITYANDDNIPSITEYTRLLRENICNLGYKIICEPGRAIVGNAGVLVTKVLYTKSNDVVKHVVVDAGMNDLIRPALYGSKHRIVLVKKNKNLPEEEVDIVGPICESDDVFAYKYKMQQVTSGDMLAICDVGAYGASMSSTYNSRPLIPEVLVNGNQFAIIRKRGSYEEMLSQDIMPNWENFE
ncbi:MAG: diaminopimelate decarboxylase [Candidatus Mesenet longicola]|uniref:Diaminopimelate decarboxylase n=1 Tax=Candidatus Mesenet longicola TaxID=1892558 RepID=A0A8J3MMB7_9RICK|nr:MAG: diaminopimelate decarboxylase [Candidatus Mesenet longicola]